VGDGDPDNGFEHVPVEVDVPEAVRTVECGEFFTCAVGESGKVYCWGRDEIGQVGDGSASSAPKHAPAEVEGIEDALDVALGNEHACAVLESGELACWGNDYHGQLGDGTSDQMPKHSPILVPDLTDVVEVTANWKHTCVRLSSGAVKCWGYDEHGQVGDGADANNKYVPVDVIGFESPD
jgi:alpha-tubulin suppressor-like RCC1 family protein